MRPLAAASWEPCTRVPPHWAKQRGGCDEVCPCSPAGSAVWGALLVALGALWWGHDLGYGLVAGGIALTVLSVIGVVVAAWRAPD